MTSRSSFSWGWKKHYSGIKRRPGREVASALVVGYFELVPSAALRPSHVPTG